MANETGDERSPDPSADTVRGGQSEEVARRVRAETAALWEALRDVLDPEIPVSVVDLGLVCDIRRDGGRVDVDVTFTSTACPAVNFIKEDIRERLLREPEVDEVAVHEAWEVAWSPRRVSGDGREGLRRHGITL